MIDVVRTRITTYIRTHKAETRLLCFLVAFALVWSQADNFRDLFTGFFDGFSDTQRS